MPVLLRWQSYQYPVHQSGSGSQALVLVNLGGATGQEVMQLASAVVASVKDKFGIDIYPEVNYI